MSKQWVRMFDVPEWGQVCAMLDHDCDTDNPQVRLYFRVRGSGTSNVALTFSGTEYGRD